MELTETQKQAVRDWVEQGCGLAEVQENLFREFGVSMTYMDVRFLTIDLGLEVRNKPSASPLGIDATAHEAPGGPPQDIGREAESLTEPTGVAGSVAVELDRVTKPGSIVSGTVTFGDGVSASWWLDQFGKLAVDAGQPGYTPSQQDLQAFQRELRKALETRGF